MGNPLAANTIIKVCNPYCGPCAKAHSVIEKLIEKDDNLKVQIIFTATDDEKDSKSKSVKHLMALNEKDDKHLIQKALDDWYMADKKDYDLFAAKYVLNGELEKQGDKLKAMSAWCDEVKIEFTPTFFINGYQLPEMYKIEEVKYFLDK
jgi:protein-disulfide isomerase